MLRTSDFADIVVYIHIKVFAHNDHGQATRKVILEVIQQWQHGSDTVYTVSQKTSTFYFLNNYQK